MRSCAEEECGVGHQVALHGWFCGVQAVTEQARSIFLVAHKARTTLLYASYPLAEVSFLFSLLEVVPAVEEFEDWHEWPSEHADGVELQTGSECEIEFALRFQNTVF